MPWKVKKVGESYKLYNIDKKRFVKKTFKTKSSAYSQKRNYEKYYKKKK